MRPRWQGVYGRWVLGGCVCGRVAPKELQSFKGVEGAKCGRGGLISSLTVTTTPAAVVRVREG
jgi:hypothetical protein